MQTALLPVMQDFSSSCNFVLSCVQTLFVTHFPQVTPVSVLRNYNIYHYVYLTRSLIRTTVDLLLVPVTSANLASVKPDRMAVNMVYLMNKGCTSHIPKFVMRLKHPLYNFRINTAYTKQDSMSVVQRMQLQTSIYLLKVRVFCKVTLLCEQYLLQYTTTFSLPLVLEEWYSTLIQ
jgi:hypothetical protein